METWKNMAIIESQFNSKSTSYIINKGKELTICIRNKKTKQFINLNTLIYVIIHELWHMICKEKGHSKLFYDINKVILKEAIKMNLYKYINYSIDNQEYCGMIIWNNVIDD